MDYEALKTKIDGGHPVTGAFDADDQLAADEFNALNIDYNKASLSGDELFRATDDTEFAALTDHKRDLWVSWCNTDRDPFDTKNVAFVQWVFGGGATTISNLSTLRVGQVSYASQIASDIDFSGSITDVHVANARALP